MARTVGGVWYESSLGVDSVSPPVTAAERRELLDEIDAQNTAEVRERAYKYARKRVDLLARCGLPIERSLAKHLMTDALGDTYMGDVDWQPSCCDLYMHLRSVIRYRTKDMLARARRLPHVRFGGVFDDEAGDRVEVEASGQMLGEDAETRTLNTDLVTRIAALLYQSAETANDQVVAQVLDAYADGVTGRAEVAERVGISRAQYDNARLRINTLLKRLPEQLSAEAEETLGRAV